MARALAQVISVSARPMPPRDQWKVWLSGNCSSAMAPCTKLEKATTMPARHARAIFRFAAENSRSAGAPAGADEETSLTPPAPPVR